MLKKITNSQSWENIFDRFDVLSEIRKNNFYDITADQIKLVDGKEPRLMTKIDFKEHLPEIMKDNKLSILAIKNGTYRIAETDPFISGISEIPKNKIIEINAPNNFLTLDPFNIRSESAALDVAFLSKICEQVFKEKTNLTIRGRLRGDLDFSLNEIQYNINGVQIEVDGGYEGETSINLIEAKIGFRGNMNIRQLLYPQLYWEKITSKRKVVKTFLFFLQGDLFRFIPYYFNEKESFLDLNDEKTFRFKSKKINEFSLYNIQYNRKILNLSSPFPQADSFERIDSLLLLLSEGKEYKIDELVLELDISSRQINYYYSVLEWMELAKKESRGKISLTKTGIRLANTPFKERTQKCAEIVFSEPILNDALHDKKLNESNFKVYNISGSTVNRRFQTVKSWIKYFKEKLCEE